MIFSDPDTVVLWIDLFFAIAAASVAFAIVAVTVGLCDLRRPTAGPVRVADGRIDRTPVEPSSRAA
jgi:hypothetical protein